jgi:hypothetical protein
MQGKARLTRSSGLTPVRLGRVDKVIGACLRGRPVLFVFGVDDIATQPFCPMKAVLPRRERRILSLISRPLPSVSDRDARNGSFPLPAARRVNTMNGRSDQDGCVPTRSARRRRSAARKASSVTMMKQVSSPITVSNVAESAQIADGIAASRRSSWAIAVSRP